MVLRRTTRQRAAILDVLRASKAHPTAASIHEEVRKRLPNVSLGTIYRNLDLLCREGRIRKLELADTQGRYDGNITPHHHVRCTECGRVADLFDLDTRGLREKAQSESGFVVSGFRIEFEGVCAPCEWKTTTTTTRR